MSALNQKWSVNIVFSDGEYSKFATCASATHAIDLVTMDARMATPNHPQFHGDVKSVTAEAVE